MRWVLRLIATGDDARCLSTDLVEICRPEGLGDIANLGLTLPEAKQLLASVQRAVVSGQVDSHALQRPCCRSCSGNCHLKDWRWHCIATLFGEVTVRLPRFLCTACNRTETGVGWPSRCRSTPELDQLQAHLSALMSYCFAAGVLQHLLPIDAGRSPKTLRNHTLGIGEQLGTATADQPTTAAAAAITVSVDSTFIRSREGLSKSLVAAAKRRQPPSSMSRWPIREGPFNAHSPCAGRGLVQHVLRLPARIPHADSSPSGRCAAPASVKRCTLSYMWGRHRVQGDSSSITPSAAASCSMALEKPTPGLCITKLIASPCSPQRKQ
jgi:hypothetical protein